jgi:hypothetical protein
LTANDRKQLFEFLPAEPQRSHVRPDKILTEIFIHFDDQRPRESRLCHDQMVAFYSHLDTTCELKDISQFLP